MPNNPPPSREALIRRYVSVSSPTVCDVLGKLGYPDQALHSSIRPLCPGARIAGPALTLRGEALDKIDNRWGSAMSYDLFRVIQPGDFIAFDCGGHVASGPWGGNTGANALARGAAGIVIDGNTRDYDDLVQMGFPTFCRAVTPVLAHGRFAIKALNEPIHLSGQTLDRVPVSPGDFIVADNDGIVIVPQQLLVEVIEFAEFAERAETDTRKAILSGEDRESIDRRIDRWALLKARIKP